MAGSLKKHYVFLIFLHFSSLFLFFIPLWLLLSSSLDVVKTILLESMCSLSRWLLQKGQMITHLAKSVLNKLV